MINDEETFVCIFILAFIKDMLQQQINADCKSIEADKDCRFCLISIEKQDNLTYDDINNEWYHYQTLALRRNDNLMIKIKKKKFFQEWKLSMNQSSLVQMTSALDIILTRSTDSAHFKYADMTNQSHHLLLEAVLIIQSCKEYTLQLQKFKFSSDWDRLQSSLFHLQSYRMQEHAYVSIIISLLLRIWLKKRCIKFKYLQATQRLFSDWMNKIERSIVDVIIATYASMMKSNILLMSWSMNSADWIQLQSIIVTARRMYQKLAECAASTIKFNECSWSQTRSLSSVLHIQNSWRQQESVNSNVFIASNVSEKSQVNEFKLFMCVIFDKKRKRENKIVAEAFNEWLSWISHFNVHVDIHYERLSDEYETVYTCNVLTSEMTYKWVSISDIWCLNSWVANS